ncbi:hypothetical protein H5T87_11025 [bacterium]|nr:hypothetical protein [bacterium]
MMRKVFLYILIVLIFSLSVSAIALKEEEHPLFQYLSRPDPAYKWEKISDEKFPSGERLIKLKMTSQIWEGIKWEHELDIILPQKLENPSVAGLLITGSGRGGILEILRIVANKTGIPMAVIFDIPNQPLFDGKTEDALLAYTFLRALETGDMSWPALYPMTKSVIRAMDTIQAISEKEWGKKVEKFVVTGASKRGWTTWFTGIADNKRVIGIAPMVYDNLNIPAQMEQQLACYGTYSEEISDYTEAQLVQRIGKDPVATAFSYCIDPYVLRFRATMPKFIINGSNDPYWTLESAHLYYPQLIGEKHILYVPNAGHGLGDGIEAVSAIAAFALARSRGEPLPAIRWIYEEVPEGLKLKIKPEGEPIKVKVWTASSDSLDFRKARWEPTELTGKEGIYEFILKRPKEGYSAIFGEVRYKIDGIEYAQSTLPKIIR